MMPATLPYEWNSNKTNLPVGRTPTLAGHPRSREPHGANALPGMATTTAP